MGSIALQSSLSLIELCILRLPKKFIRMGSLSKFSDNNSYVAGRHAWNFRPGLSSRTSHGFLVLPRTSLIDLCPILRNSSNNSQPNPATELFRKFDAWILHRHSDRPHTNSCFARAVRASFESRRVEGTYFTARRGQIGATSWARDLQTKSTLHRYTQSHE